MLAAACGGDDDDSSATTAAAVTTVAGATPTTASSASTPTSGGAGGTVIVGSADFPESQLLAQIYGQALAKAGFDVDYQLAIGAREVYYKAHRERRDRPRPRVHQLAADVRRCG